MCELSDRQKRTKNYSKGSALEVSVVMLLLVAGWLAFVLFDVKTED